MKRIFSLLTLVLIAVSVFTLAPQKMSYQTVIQNSNNTLINSTNVVLHICILHDSSTGTDVNVETQSG